MSACVPAITFGLATVPAPLSNQRLSEGSGDGAAAAEQRRRESRSRIIGAAGAERGQRRRSDGAGIAAPSELIIAGQAAAVVQRQAGGIERLRPGNHIRARHRPGAAQHQRLAEGSGDGAAAAEQRRGKGRGRIIGAAGSERIQRRRGDRANCSRCGRRGQRISVHRHTGRTAIGGRDRQARHATILPVPTFFVS